MGIDLVVEGPNEHFRISGLIISKNLEFFSTDKIHFSITELAAKPPLKDIMPSSSKSVLASKV